MRLIRELLRRKLRTTLTVLGITIGIWSLVVFSSMANKINSFVDAGSAMPCHRGRWCRPARDESADRADASVYRSA